MPAASPSPRSRRPCVRQLGLERGAGRAGQESCTRAELEFHLAGMTEAGLATRERPSPPANRSGVNSTSSSGTRVRVSEGQEERGEELTGELLACDGLHGRACARV